LTTNGTWKNGVIYTYYDAPASSGILKILGGYKPIISTSCGKPMKTWMKNEI
jgi:hypothetical protein